jgi:SNF family Na+-dependent transporter
MEKYGALIFGLILLLMAIVFIILEIRNCHKNEKNPLENFGVLNDIFGVIGFFLLSMSTMCLVVFFVNIYG